MKKTFNKILKEMHSALLRDDKEVMEMIINIFVSEVEIGPNYVHIYIETKGPPIFFRKSTVRFISTKCYAVELFNNCLSYT